LVAPGYNNYYGRNERGLKSNIEYNNIRRGEAVD
jgi:hypothetical protein